MTILLSIATIICVAYLAYSMLKGIPESLSATYYSLGKHGWVFQLVMAAIAFLLIIVWLPLCDGRHQWTAFLSCASLLFVSAAPAFRLSLDGAVHYTSAIICCVCAVLWQILEGLWDVTLWFAFIGGMLTLMWRDKWCWWVECAVVGSVFANLWRIV